MTAREEALARCFREEQMKAQQLRHEVAALEAANAELLVERDTTDHLLGTAMDLLQRRRSA